MLVFPDAVRGVEALLDVEILGHTLHPVLHLPADVFEPTDDERVVVHVQRDAVDQGAVDRVEEVRYTVYGASLLDSTDLAEAILSFISGDGVQTPAVPDHAAAFYFDSIRHRIGPTPLDYPNNTVFPVVTVVACRARPMS